MGPFLYHPPPVIFSISYRTRGVGVTSRRDQIPSGIVERVSTLSGPKTHPGKTRPVFHLAHGGGCLHRPLLTRPDLDDCSLSYPAFHIAHGGWFDQLTSPAATSFFGPPSSNPLYRLYSANLIPYTVSIFIYSFDLTAQTWLTATIKNLSQSIKGRLQEGVQNSVFQDKGTSRPRCCHRRGPDRGS